MEELLASSYVWLFMLISHIYILYFFILLALSYIYTSSYMFVHFVFASIKLRF